MGAAGLDVVPVKPSRPDSPPLTAKNGLITPHIAGVPREKPPAPAERRRGQFEKFFERPPT
ncbi:MAG: hypothetical protein LBU12_03275 [Deltaproteobacteria bacterium]|nr:hypothetical protein [Deltaproteobacteria bacterium]